MDTRVKAEKSKKEGDIFEAKKEAYKPSEQRKADQAAVDAQVIISIFRVLNINSRFIPLTSVLLGPGGDQGSC